MSSSCIYKVGGFSFTLCIYYIIKIFLWQRKSLGLNKRLIGGDDAAQLTVLLLKIRDAGAYLPLQAES